ncbi:FUSC family protein [Rhodococcus sp. ZPP]|uniref:FUSC family protein n=1 Tax=Rhodococcus sp. ZPP TaxID=2749906 RepID=UPI001FCD1092|nr:FUSC family protein [Rhodococcus sp. ZPP]
MFRRLRTWTSDADRGTVLIQAVKAATAAVLAWVLAAMVFALPQPFLAPYAAVFMIEATVSRSLRVAAEQLAAVSLGVVLAAAVGALVDSITVGVGIAVLMGLLLGRWRRLGSSGIWVAVTALLMVTYGAAEDPDVLGLRIVEIALGAATGVAVNALFLPPLYVKRSQRAVTGVGVTAANLLAEVPEELRAGPAAGQLRGTSGRRRSARNSTRRSEAVAWTEESARGNLRSAASRRSPPRNGGAAPWSPCPRRGPNVPRFCARQN